MERDHPVLGRDVAVIALDELAERVARLERVVEPGAPVPQILESFVDGVQHVPKERVQGADRGLATTPDLGTYRRRCFCLHHRSAC